MKGKYINEEVYYPSPEEMQAKFWCEDRGITVDWWFAPTEEDLIVLVIKDSKKEKMGEERYPRNKADEARFQLYVKIQKQFS